jgi:isoleucyl-tRNA synthetase
VRTALDGYDAMRGTRAIESFVDELSNWYVRRNRRRFWKGELDADKRGAYATLYEVLITLCRLMAPFVPHLADAMWHNLVATVDATRPDSVHLTDAPDPSGRSDAGIDAAVSLARRTVALGRAARSASAIRTRQPLRAVRLKLPAAARGALSPDPTVAEELTREIADELNVRAIELIPDESEMVERTLYPLLPVVGPRHGKSVGAIMAGARSGEWALRDDGTVLVGGVTLAADEFELTARARSGQEVAEDGDLLVALDTAVDDELAAEGLAREVAHLLQAMRRAAGYEISDRVRIAVSGDSGVLARLDPHTEWLASELLAAELSLGPTVSMPDADRTETATLDGATVELSLVRA